MWKSFLQLATMSVIVMVISGSAFADQFSFTSAGSVTWNGVYVNPYTATDLTPGHAQTLTIYCDDWNTDFSGNPTWTGNVYTLTADNVSNFKYGNTTPNYNVSLDAVNNKLSVTSSSTPTPFDRYLEAAWLDDQWRNASGTSAGTKDMQIEIAAAEWTLFVDTAHVGDGSVPTNGLIGAINSSGYATAVYDYLRDAQNAVAGAYTAPGWDVIVPDGLNSNGQNMQEFLVHAPEPSALILLGTVIGYVGLTKFRRKRQA
jgi:hypothetical protein